MEYYVRELPYQTEVEQTYMSHISRCMLKFTTLYKWLVTFTFTTRMNSQLNWPTYITTSWLYMICTYLAFLFLECGGHGGDGRCPRRFQSLCIHSETQSRIQALETSFQCKREQSASFWSLITIEKALLHTPCACRDWSPMVRAWHILQRISEHTDL